MEIDRTSLLYAFFITLIIFMAVLLIGSSLSTQRENYIESALDEIVNEVEGLQTFMLMGDVYGDEMACIVYSRKIHDMNRPLWDLGARLDQYRAATEEFRESEFYREQKIVFNENQLQYMMFIRFLQERCDFEQDIITFFYRDSEECPKCDDQSFVLRDVDYLMDEEVFIFAYDYDLGLGSVEGLAKYYEVDEFPCVIINDEKHCGIQSRDFIISVLQNETNDQI